MKHRNQNSHGQTTKSAHHQSIQKTRLLGLLTLSNLNLSTRAASSPGSSEVASSHSSGLGFHSRMLNAQRMAWGLLLDTDDAGAATDACRQKTAAHFKGAVGGNRSRFQSDNNHDSRMSHVNHATITTATGQW